MILLILTVLPFVLSPGASFALTIGAAATREPYAALKVWLGTTLGLIVLALFMSISSLSVWMLERPLWSMGLTACGGIVLLAFAYMNARRALSAASHLLSSKRLVYSSFLVLVSNMKAWVIYMFVVPTLAHETFYGATLYAAFTAVHAGLLLVWLVLWAEMVRKQPLFARSHKARKILLLIAAGCMAVMGANALWDTGQMVLTGLK